MVSSTSITTDRPVVLVALFTLLSWLGEYVHNLFELPQLTLLSPENSIPALISLVLFLAWWLSPTQVVKRRTNRLMDVMSMSEGSSPATRQLGVYSLNSLIARELVLDTPTISDANGIFERSQIESGFSWLAGNAKSSALTIEDIESITVNGNEATVRAAIDAVVILSDYRPADGLYEVELDWRKEDDGWRLTRAQWRDAR